MVQQKIKTKNKLIITSNVSILDFVSTSLRKKERKVHTNTFQLKKIDTAKKKIRRRKLKRRNYLKCFNFMYLFSISLQKEKQREKDTHKHISILFPF